MEVAKEAITKVPYVAHLKGMNGVTTQERT